MFTALWIITGLLWLFVYSTWAFYRYLNGQSVLGPDYSYGPPDIGDVAGSIFVFGVMCGVIAPVILGIGIPAVLFIGGAYQLAKILKNYKIEIKK